LLRPTDFAIDEDSERVFIINAGRNRIDAFHDRQFLTRWGREGDAPGTFRLSGTATVIEALSTSTTAERQVVAGGIARDAEGYLYVADTFNNRIQKFQP
jgi:DNA-binding beta-propeller fold protein YncE